MRSVRAVRWSKVESDGAGPLPVVVLSVVVPVVGLPADEAASLPVAPTPPIVLLLVLPVPLIVLPVLSGDVVLVAPLVAVDPVVPGVVLLASGLPPRLGFAPVVVLGLPVLPVVVPVVPGALVVPAASALVPGAAPDVDEPVPLWA